MSQTHRRHDGRARQSQSGQSQSGRSQSHQSQSHQSQGRQPIDGSRFTGPPPRRQPAHRHGPTGLVTCLALLIGVAVSVWIVVSPTSHADGLTNPQAAGTAAHTSAHKSANNAPRSAPVATTAPAPKASVTPKPVVKPWHYRDLCPEKTFACVDLKDKVSWLQINGVVMYGPVRIEPGSPGQVTPVGNFTVSWKDKHHISSEFNEAMPDAVFFAPGGIAFHVGSLTKGSHGCVHLSVPDANYYFNQLAVGATVSVF